jgi:hypothetical protein
MDLIEGQVGIVRWMFPLLFTGLDLTWLLGEQVILVQGVLPKQIIAAELVFEVLVDNELAQVGIFFVVNLALAPD